jgi:signal transduction histidine kinase
MNNKNSENENALRLRIKELEDELEDLRVSSEDTLTKLETSINNDEVASLELLDVKSQLDERKSEIGKLNVTHSVETVELGRIHRVEREELEITNEELQVTSAELEASNEELQSTSAELEASIEELQATSAELEARNSELLLLNTTLAEEVEVRKKAEEELLSSKELVEKASQAKSEFLSTMSHELRTPMNSILGFGQLLISNSNDVLSTDHQDSVNHMMESARHLLELIDQVLNLSMIESGHLKLAVENLSLNKLCAECLISMESGAHERGISVTGDLGANF